MPHRLTNNYQADVIADHPGLGETWRPGKAGPVIVAPTLCAVWPEHRMAFDGTFMIFQAIARFASLFSRSLARHGFAPVSLPRPWCQYGRAQFIPAALFRARGFENPRGAPISTAASNDVPPLPRLGETCSILT